MANKKIPFKFVRPVEEWLQDKGKFLSGHYFSALTICILLCVTGEEVFFLVIVLTLPHLRMFLPGRQLTIFNTQAVISVGGRDRNRPFQGQLSGLYYNGLRVLHMAVESNQNIKVNGSVRLVGDVPSVVGAARSTGMPPEMSATLIETTTMMSTTTTRKHRSSSTVQVCTHLQDHKTNM